VNAGVVLGVDPGLSVSGFGVMRIVERKVQLIECGALKLPAKESIPRRIGLFYDFFSGKVREHGVSMLVLETPFLGKNAQNFLKLGYLRGVLSLIVEQHALQLGEFAPREVKALVTGYGHADKDQVARVMHRFFPTLATQRYQDTTDAVAITLCGAWKLQIDSALAGARERASRSQGVL